MDSTKGSEIWKNENRDLEIDKFIRDFVEELKGVSQSNKDSSTLKILREILEENKILEGTYE